MAKPKLTEIQRAVLTRMAANPHKSFNGYGLRSIHPRANTGTLRQLRAKGYVRPKGEVSFSYTELTRYVVTEDGVEAVSVDD